MSIEIGKSKYRTEFIDWFESRYERESEKLDRNVKILDEFSSLTECDLFAIELKHLEKLRILLDEMLHHNYYMRFGKKLRDPISSKLGHAISFLKRYKEIYSFPSLIKEYSEYLSEEKFQNYSKSEIDQRCFKAKKYVYDFLKNNYGLLLGEEKGITDSILNDLYLSTQTYSFPKSSTFQSFKSFMSKKMND